MGLQEVLTLTSRVGSETVHAKQARAEMKMKSHS